MTSVHGGEQVVLDYFCPRRDAGGGWVQLSTSRGACLGLWNERWGLQRVGGVLG